MGRETITSTCLCEAFGGILLLAMWLPELLDALGPWRIIGLTAALFTVIGFAVRGSRLKAEG